MTPLTRDLVQRIAADEAQRSRCTLDELIHMSTRAEAKAARIRAWARIIAETGCTGSELARIWGCEREAIYRAFPKKRTWTVEPKPRPEPEPKPLYDAATKARLYARYRSIRADRIIEGRDPETQADIAAWRALGRREKAA